MASGNKLTPSLEDYLEAILDLEEKYRVARVKDIATQLKVQMPSVTGALKNLREKELVNYERNSYISLTKKGMEIAKQIRKKHLILTRFLHETLCIEADLAEDQACKIEHIIDSDTTSRIAQLADFIRDRVLKDMPMDEWKKILS
jgi:DtxR family Mn-dependent transcriptional regulator